MVLMVRMIASLDWAFGLLSNGPKQFRLCKLAENFRICISGD
jgi:hypothetical protein